MAAAEEMTVAEAEAAMAEAGAVVMVAAAAAVALRRSHQGGGVSRHDTADRTAARVLPLGTPAPSFGTLSRVKESSLTFCSNCPFVCDTYV